MICPSLKITFLGTGTSTGVPMIGCTCEVCTSASKKDKRLRTSIVVESESTTFVIDTTPDFRYQMLRANIKKLDAILFTHPHKDHIAGLDDVKAFCYFSNKPMQIFANAFTEEAIKREFHYAFAENKYPGIPNLHLNTIALEPFIIGDIPIIPILVWHLNMAVYGYRIGNFTYITDVNRIEEHEKNKIKGSKIMVVNALRHQKHISHYTLEEAIDLTNELNIPTAYFTHIGHQLGKYDDISASLPGHIKLAYDELELFIETNKSTQQS